MGSKTTYSIENNDSKSIGRATESQCCNGDDLVVKKRKVSISYPESPSKRQRVASNPSEVPAEDVTAKGTKRKASTERVVPSKRQRAEELDTKAGEPSKVSVEEVREAEREKQNIAEQPPATEPPRTTSGDIHRPVSCSPSTSQQTNGTPSCSVRTKREIFEDYYLELSMLGQGGFGSVYEGLRKADNLPVAIKHIPKARVVAIPWVLHGKTCMVPLEVLLMQIASGGPACMGKSAAVSLLDWYDLDDEVLIVMERPVPYEDLLTYVLNNRGPISEAQAKNIMKQMVEAAVKMHSVGVFHRDIKGDNILIELGSDVPRVRVIDFGCGCMVTKEPYRTFSGTFQYAPPEYILDRSYRAGPCTVWQLGTLLFELIDGRRRFTTKRFLDKTIKISSRLSNDCQDLLKACLAVKQEERITLKDMLKHPWFN